MFPFVNRIADDVHPMRSCWITEIAQLPVRETRSSRGFDYRGLRAGRARSRVFAPRIGVVSARPCSARQRHCVRHAFAATSVERFLARAGSARASNACHVSCRAGEEVGRVTLAGVAGRKSSRELISPTPRRAPSPFRERNVAHASTLGPRGGVVGLDRTCCRRRRCSDCSLTTTALSAPGTAQWNVERQAERDSG